MQDHNKSELIYKASMQSKKILMQKENKYVPIHQRANEVVRERQCKLAKLQKEQEIAALVKEKECTFKPVINKPFRQSKIHTRKTTTEQSCCVSVIQHDDKAEKV